MIFKVIGQRVRVICQIFRQGDMPRFALPLFSFILVKDDKLDITMTVIIRNAYAKLNYCYIFSTLDVFLLSIKAVTV